MTRHIGVPKPAATAGNVVMQTAIDCKLQGDENWHLGRGLETGGGGNPAEEGRGVAPLEF